MAGSKAVAKGGGGSGSGSAAAAGAPLRALTVAEGLYCGAIARCAQVLTMYPVDTVKTRVQFSRKSGTTVVASLRAAVGAGGLYRAVWPSMLGQIPYGMVTFGALEATRSAMRERNPSAPRWVSTVVAAAVGDTLGSLWLTPVEVIKQKTQAGVYQGAGAAVAGVSRGGVGAFYQGYAAALARDVPFRIVQFVVFERILALFRGRVKRETTPLENLAFGALAGTTAAAMTCPLDVVRTRMMAQATGADRIFSSALDCVLKTVRTEGVLAMYRGIAPRCALIGPSSAVFFLAYEASKRFFLRRNTSSLRVATCSRPRSKRVC